MNDTQMGCFVFFGRKWRRHLTLSNRLRYHPLSEDEEDDCNRSENSVKVVVGKERRVFVVDPSVLEKEPFRVLLEKTTDRRSKSVLDRNQGGRVIVAGVDSMLFDHMLWSMENDNSSFFQLNLNLWDIIEFYAEDY